MSIASRFTSSEEYFEKCVSFLQKYAWIYETSNTCFIRDGVLEIFPSEWTKYFAIINIDELNAFPTRKSKTNIPNLDEFIQELDELTPNHEQLNIPHIDYKLKKMSLKKQHEISKLSTFIQSVCTNEIDAIVDFGSGLGYLSELLHTSNAYKILGLESDASRVRTSIERQEAIYPSSKKNVVFREHFVTEDSKDFILAHVEKMTASLEPTRLAIVGLHACADLTINSIKLFFAIENAQKLVIMPCCYHKLDIETEPNRGSFKNFPLSKALKTAESGNKTFQGFNRPFLRLACQQTSARWRKLTENEHNVHSADMFLRGIAEAILIDGEMVVKLNSKKVVQLLNFNEFCSVYELRLKTTKERLYWTLHHERRFAELIQKYPLGPKLAEGLTCLQATMQGLCENVVLYDRICYMQEQSLERNINISVRFEKIMDELLSPRCYALIALKL